MESLLAQLVMLLHQLGQLVLSQQLLHLLSPQVVQPVVEVPQPECQGMVLVVKVSTFNQHKTLPHLDSPQVGIFRLVLQTELQPAGDVVEVFIPLLRVQLVGGQVRVDQTEGGLVEPQTDPHGPLVPPQPHHLPLPPGADSGRPDQGDVRLELSPGVDQQHHPYQPHGAHQAVLGPGVEAHCKSNI